MPYPSDYNDAVQALGLKFRDPDIKSGTIAERDALGLPIPYSGNFACVYKIRSVGKLWAIRFFLNISPEMSSRYAAIKDFIKSNPKSFFVDFDYQEQAVLVNGNWYPLVKMPWIEGRTLDRYVRDTLNNSQAILNVAADFADVVEQLKVLGVAHGDLQHGNIMVTMSGIRLIDYDGLYCHATAGIKSKEIGMPNYQHPGRRAGDAGVNVDDFSAWIIYISLQLVALDRSFFSDNDALVFEKSDFVSPTTSQTVRRVLHHANQDVRALGSFLVNSVLVNRIGDVPNFTKSIDPKVVGNSQKVPSTWWVEEKKTDEVNSPPIGSGWVSDWIKKKI